MIGIVHLGLFEFVEFFGSRDQLDRFWKHDHFQECIYAFAHDHGLNGQILFENVGCDNQSTLLIVKRLISGMYQHNHFIMFASDSNQNQVFWVQLELYSQTTVIWRFHFCYD